MIAVLVQPASFFPLLPPSELAVFHLVIGTAAGHHCQTTIGPQLSLGAKPVWGSAKCPKVPPPESDQSKESHTAVSKSCASCSWPADLYVLTGARLSAHPAVGSTTPPAGAPRVPGSSRATLPDAASHRPACRCREWPSCDRWLLIRLMTRLWSLVMVR